MVIPAPLPAGHPRPAPTRRLAALLAASLLFFAAGIPNAGQAAAPSPDAAPGPSTGSADVLVVTATPIKDRKAVFATVESADTVQARARIGGTVGSLVVDEGDEVTAGQRLAVVGDKKLLLQMQAIEARGRSLAAELDLARTELDRARTLRRQGAGTQQRLDDADTRVRVLTQNLEAVEKDKAVLARQVEDGAVLAPGAGRVLTVHVTDGAVILPGEVIATIASQASFLRMRLPERHARFLQIGDVVEVGPRGLDPTAEGERSLGKVVQVYPRLDQGRVIADVAVDGLGGYFVGERALVFVPTGHRDAILVPPDYLFRRFGLTFATLADGTEIVVQTGRAMDARVEVLAGLSPGDRIRKPDPARLGDAATHSLTGQGANG